jgi:beta-galactosidase
MNETPMQRKLRALAPMPAGVVFLPWPGMTEEEARQHFRLMRELGFTCLKQTMATPEWPVERTLTVALEEGVWPFWYAEGGFEEVTPELLKQLGLPPTLDVDTALEHPRMQTYQRELMRRRIGEGPSKVRVSDGEIESEPREKDWVPGVVGDVKGHELSPGLIPKFIEWLRTRYGTVEALWEAWNHAHVGVAEARHEWRSLEDVEAALREGYRTTDYRHIIDALRFRADMFLEWVVRPRVVAQQRTDPNAPVRAGGEMGLFLPFASRGTDMEGIAREMAAGGSFYPSIHLAWHFEEVKFETARPVFMQAQLAADWAKGIWSATWESTGGPQYFSGGKAPFVPEVRNTTAGFTVDAGVITQLMLSYLAAGFKGFGLWAWNARTAGWEAGEYALMDRNRQPTERARRAGEIARAARRYRRELWRAHKEPLVGVLVDWDNEAVWAAMSVQGRDFFKNVPVRARIGVSRALINANVPWEYVTARNLRDGLAARYPAIYLPALLGVSSDLWSIFEHYVKEGGRLVLDMPGAYFDEYGRIFSTQKGSPFERLFGGVLREFGYSRSINVPYAVNGLDLGEGFVCSLAPTTARVRARYDHDLGPAVMENRLGKGTAVVLGCQASLSCLAPGNTAMERFLVRQTLGPMKSPYTCQGALAYRLAAPEADHYFLINDGPAGLATLSAPAFRYRTLTDAISGKAVPRGKPIALEAHSGRWLRCERNPD